MKQINFSILLFFTVFSIGAILVGATHHLLTLGIVCVFWLLYYRTYVLKKPLQL